MALTRWGREGTETTDPNEERAKCDRDAKPMLVQESAPLTAAELYARCLKAERDNARLRAQLTKAKELLEGCTCLHSNATYDNGVEHYGHNEAAEWAIRHYVEVMLFLQGDEK